MVVVVVFSLGLSLAADALVVVEETGAGLTLAAFAVPSWRAVDGAGSLLLVATGFSVLVWEGVAAGLASTGLSSIATLLLALTWSLALT